VKHLEKENVRLTTLDPAQASKLDNYPNPKVREIARKLRGMSTPEDRQEVFKSYRDEALAPGDAAEGKKIFVKNCSSCHEIGGVGVAVGPNLAAMVNRGGESVLFNILAPNVEVDPRFMEYIVLTNDGQVITGVVAGLTSTAVTIRGPENKLTTVLRVDIDDMRTTNKSLMPEGLEKVIDKKSMSNLLTFLKQAAASQGGSK
jgi:putative heme-binding domain-containing protein